MHEKLYTTIILGGLMAVAPPSNGGTITLNNATTANQCTYTSISVGTGGDVTVECETGGATTPPGKPGSVAATPFNAKINVAYGAAAPNGLVITNYEASCTSSDGGTTPVTVQSGNGTATSIMVNGVTNDKSYTCTVRAYNSAGWGDASDPSASVVPLASLVDPGPPAKPTAPTAVAGSGSIALTFAAPASNGSTISGYDASCTSSDGGAAKTGNTTNPSATTLTVTGLSGGKTYACTVRAKSNLGDGPYSDPSASVTVGAVVGCGATPAGTSVVASWAGYPSSGKSEDTGTIATGQAKAYGFVADQAMYPNGNRAKVEVNTQTGGSNRADIAVSACPGDFTNVQPGCYLANVRGGGIYTTFDPANTTFCLLVPGQQYYFNIRPNVNFPNVAKVIGSQKL